MKKQSINAISNKVFTFLFVAFLLTGTVSMANPQVRDTTVNSAKGAEISYEGLRGKQLVFNVAYKNGLSESFQLIIKNDFEEVIYFKAFDAQPLNTKLFFSEIPENCKLTFLIKTGKKEISQAFKISSEVKTVEEYVVKGL